MILKVTSRIARWGRLLFLPCLGCRRSYLPARNTLFSISFVFVLFFIIPINIAGAIQLNSDSDIATAGYFQLHWSGASKVFQLQESASLDFQSYRVVYEGLDIGRIVSGKPNGIYYYRVVAGEESSQVSNLVKVTVSHHSLEKALLFFLLGAIVFIFTIVLIFRGSKRAVR